MSVEHSENAFWLPPGKYMVKVRQGRYGPIRTGIVEPTTTLDDYGRQVWVLKEGPLAPGGCEVVEVTRLDE